ncbi:MAG: polyprenyl synthetase family protein [Halorhodospira halophila]|uniref:polyprenyl synthetase family protein n=1 Tax=Halorhodospira TaxID=85108 RepID=UPI0019141D59|nr:MULTISPECIES: farnesyl diphosphate synthase [Halorhodospira]MBK5944296.1 geranyl transferase [Halorhodospira halophila]MCC3750087.1 polyprenyl synthetase family protein [Halorhodospira halophila]MCG5527583.1 polyprenyl synthetase family protein [Halorhodospira halophila]MCG5532602.1 polyprenyl synthetase family protein [Halorhodospira sp. 9621]MCG5539004.1 polyprenyl synthetase family protein [Halorhodospira sp. 9622]
MSARFDPTILEALEAALPPLRERAERALEAALPAAEAHPTGLHEAMRYAVLGGGKRMRPTLVYATGRALDYTGSGLDAPACAVEMIHAYSLVHDDLPAMDDDDMRRGQPTCHRAYDEPTAILVGDALQARAFELLADGEREDAPAPAARAGMVQALARAAGSRGMVGGQAIDLASVGRRLDAAELEDMHIHKTGALIRASVQLGALASGPTCAATLNALDRYAKCVGLAFQIHDDVLDVEGDAKALGKEQGADAARDKPTYPSILGLRQSRELAERLAGDAIDALDGLGPGADVLRGLAAYCIQRQA